MLIVVLSTQCDQAFDLWQKLELAFELEFNLLGTVDLRTMCLIDFSAGKELVSFDRSYNGCHGLEHRWACRKIIF